MVQSERRADPRVQIARPCKIYVPKIGRYLSGTTWDLSAGGALLEVHRPDVLLPGDHLYVGIALKRRQAILRAGDMFSAHVVRSSQTARDRTALAVRFVTATAAEADAVRRAA